MADVGRSSGPPPRTGPRDPGDAWVEGPDGTRAWGRFGAAGLLVVDPRGRVLLQHRVEWSHHGGTWGIPGGARHQHEGALAGGIREAVEEAGVPAHLLEPVMSSVLDLGFWSYTTIVATAGESFEPVVADPESLELRWVPAEEVEALPLHPGFADAWPMLRGVLGRSLTVVVDAANVVGSRPDGWWRDRAGAADRLLARLGPLAVDGLPAHEAGLPGTTWWPRVVVVLEGAGRGATDRPGAVEVLRADHDGDQAIVDAVAGLRGATTSDAGMSEAGMSGAAVIVVTADRELRDRVTRLGADVRGPSWLDGLVEPGT